MEPTATTAPPSPARIDEIRAEFPILAREVHGEPLAYLDNGATAQKPLAVIEALDRYWREQNANVHRGVHTLSEEATALYEEARGDRRVASRRRPARGDLRPQRDRGAQPRRLLVGPHERLRGRPDRGHRDGAPLERRALVPARPGEGRPPRLGADHRRGPARHWTPSPRCSSAGRSSSASPTSRTSSARSTRSPRSPAWPTTPGRCSSSTVPRPGPKLELDMAELGADFYALTAHKMYGPTGIGALFGRRELLEEMPPFIGGGSMIKKVGQGADHLGRSARRSSRAARRRSARRSASAPPFAGSTISACPRFTPRRRS